MMTGMMKAAAKTTAAMLAAATVLTAAAPATAYAAEYYYVEDYVRLEDMDTSEVGYYQTVQVVNNTGKALQQLYVSASFDNDWGEDILGVYYMDNGDIAETSFPVYCNCTNYDILAVFADGTSHEYDNVNIYDVPVAGFVLQLDPNAASLLYL